MGKSIALIIAAGKGKRYAGSVPKQYELLNGEPILWHSIQAFLNNPQIDAVIVVIHPEHENLYQNIRISGYSNVEYCFGGEERQDSVRLGLEAAAKFAPKNVLIHDAARPFVSHEVIFNVLEKLVDSQAVIPIIECNDSIRYDAKPIEREKVRFVQTPQGFDYEMILKAHQDAQGSAYTDDAQIAEAAGVEITYSQGDARNIKITTRADMQNRKSEVQQRVGMGFDVHAFGEGDSVTICGVKIPHSRALQGHSDADVGLHALTDAILGAIGEGDIGEHFPPSEAKWAGMDSSFFLAKAALLLAAKHGRVVNVDVTIICEEPKITPHKSLMRENIAKILNIGLDAVNIKATTTEKLGFTGRGEGIAAQAVASVEIIK
jgi:2-C-methyl-D-erythritol 4-phosphate cytidylyltransferase/2-C-methyl-D-erythritol 2,4-cyclodiphosphate synthase